MQNRRKAVAFDVDTPSLLALQQVLPEWQIETVAGATTNSIDRDWNPAAMDLLVVGARDNMAETLGLCRSLRSQAGRAQTPLLVLIPAGQDNRANTALQAGAQVCLALPLDVNTLRSALAGVVAVPHPLDPWQDDGGES